MLGIVLFKHKDIKGSSVRAYLKSMITLFTYVLKYLSKKEFKEIEEFRELKQYLKEFEMIPLTEKERKLSPSEQETIKQKNLLIEDKIVEEFLLIVENGYKVNTNEIKN